MRPVPASRKPYLELGDVPIRFGQSRTCLYLLASTMEFRLPEAHPALRMAALSEIRRRINEAPFGLVTQVRHTVGPLLASGACALADTARQLDLHPRTLERRLRDEGTSFVEIRDNVRFAAARGLLDLTPLSVLEIGLSLGFSTQSAFIRAFQRWSGTSPARWRRQSGLLPVSWKKT